MKIEAFTTLVAILKSKTMAAAAEKLNLTPSAVSMQVKQLESYLGQPLFDRSALRVKPLPVAQELVDVIQPALARLEELRRRSRPTIEGHLKLGIINSMQPTLLPPTLLQLRAHYPGLQIALTRGKSLALIASVKAGQLDAAVVAQPENAGSARLTWHPLLEDQLFLIAPPDEEETSATRLFAQYEWICYDTNTVAGRLAARYVGTHFKARRSTIEFDERRAIVSMVSVGLGISVMQLAEPSIFASYPVRVLPLANSPVVSYSVVCRKGDGDSRANQALLSVLRNAAEQIGDRYHFRVS